MSVTVKITGMITDIFPPEIRGNFEKCVVWIQEPGTDARREHWALEFWQGDATIPESFKVGQMVTCNVDIKGKHWSKDGRSGIIVTLKCFKMDRVQGAAPAPAAPQQTTRQAAAAPHKPVPPANGTDDVPLDDCPF